MKTEERILANALQHFCDFGYSGTSVREITTASEVTKPTLYYYFKNKQELFSKLAETSFAKILTTIESAVSQQKTFDGALAALFKAIYESFNENPSGLRFIHSILVAPQKGAPNVGVETFSIKLESFVEKILDNAVKNGECLESKKENTHILCSALFGLYTKNVVTGGAESFDLAHINRVVKALCACASNSACAPH